MMEYVLILIFVTGSPRVTTEHIPFATKPACEQASTSIGANKEAAKHLAFNECFHTGLGKPPNQRF